MKSIHGRGVDLQISRFICSIVMRSLCTPFFPSLKFLNASNRVEVNTIFKYIDIVNKNTCLCFGSNFNRLPKNTFLLLL